MGWREAERSERRGEWLEKWLRGYAVLTKSREACAVR
jgi:hypothetical protein